MVHFQDLPLEIHLSVDGYLELKDRLQCKRVCRQWYGIFDGLQDKVTTIDTPAKYWSLVKKYSCKYIRRTTSLALENIPIDLGMDLVARSSISLASLSLKMQDHKATELAFSEQCPLFSAYTSDGPRWKLYITRMLRVYGHSLSSLVLSYPTSQMNVDMDALLTALPSCLNTLVLHQIDIPLSVLDLELIYSSCGHVSEISLQGSVFKKLDYPAIQHSTSGNQSSIRSLELDFGTVDSVRQIMEFITVAHPDRHLKLQHINMDFGHLPPNSWEATQPLGRVDDCPQQIYDTFAKNCQQLSTLSFSRVLLVGLLDALYYQMDDQYHGPVRLTIHKSIIYDKRFTSKVKEVIGQVIESISVVGRISRINMLALRDQLGKFKHLRHLELYGDQQQIGELGLMKNIFSWEPYNYRSLETDRLPYMKKQKLHAYLPTNWSYGVGLGRKTGWQWLLDPLSNSLTSLTLHQLPILFCNYDLYLSTRLRKLTLQKNLLDGPYLKLLFFLDALEDLHLDQCFTTSARLHLNLIASTKFKRLEISQLAMQWYEQGSILPTPLSALYLFQARNVGTPSVEQKFRNLNGYKGALYVACKSLQVLVVDGKCLLE